MYIANLGDSTAVLIRAKSQFKKMSIRLTNEHKPTDPVEKARIVKAGGKIERIFYKGEFTGPYRVWANSEGPGIAMSRSLGDLNGKKIGMIAIPEIEIIDLRETDKFVVLGSDGIFDVMKCTEVVSYVIRCEDKENAAKYLAKEARSRWQDLNLCKKTKTKIADLPGAKSGIDDITAIVLFFDFMDGQGERYNGMDIISNAKYNEKMKAEKSRLSLANEDNQSKNSVSDMSGELHHDSPKGFINTASKRYKENSYSEGENSSFHSSDKGDSSLSRLKFRQKHKHSRSEDSINEGGTPKHFPKSKFGGLAKHGSLKFEYKKKSSLKKKRFKNSKSSVEQHTSSFTQKYNKTI